MGSKAGREAVHRHAFKTALSKVAAAGKRLRRGREKRRRPKFLPGHVADPLGAPAAASPDPVKIAVLAIENVGRASTRACFTGTEIEVAVPDHATAAILRAALSETARSRATDRLVRIVVD